MNKEILEFVNKCENEIKDILDKIDDISLYNQEKVIEAFQKNQVALRHFSGTTGYGYDDIGRDTLYKVYADVFHAESAIVSPHLLSGTHTITVALFGLLRPNDTMLSISGIPYDTLQGVIFSENKGSLKDFGVNYKQIDLINNDFDYDKIAETLKNEKIKIVYLQRSRGYEFRNAIKIDQIEKVCKLVHSIDPKMPVVIDNCYGEFVCKQEPTDVGANIVIGSLIKNIGGGIAPTGGYIAGDTDLIEQISYRLTTPSVGLEIGSYQSGYQYFYQGLFMAPHVTACALKGATLISYAMEKIGYKTLPKYNDEFSDIVCSIIFNNEKELCDFCETIQSVSPIDSFVTPIPWEMPGYEEKVIMAAGCFVQGASIELSADSPIKEPYVAYLQGGITYEHVKLALIKSLEKLNFKNKI